MTRIACTEIGGRIMAGRANKAGDSFTGTPKDVTSDVLKTVIDKLDVAGNPGKLADMAALGLPFFCCCQAFFTHLGHLGFCPSYPNPKPAVSRPL